MKKFIFICFLFMLCLTGCQKENADSIIKKLDKKISKTDSYHLTGIMQLVNNEDKYLYDIDVSYNKNEQYRVSLKNQTNNHEQIILKNNDGVYVLTPSLNKSFKFQSEWPYNSSQSYLLQNIVDDIKNDKDRKFKLNDKEYIFEVKANYINNKDLKTQKIYIDKNNNVKRIEVLDKNKNVKINMQIKTIDFKAKFEKDYFNLKENISVSKEINKKTQKKLSDIVYPMYLPENTTLENQSKIKKENGERVILNFGGDKKFTLIEETIDYDETINTIPVNGEMIFVTDVVGNMNENSISWISNNVEYYITSSNLSNKELISIANSMSILPVSK